MFQDKQYRFPVKTDGTTKEVALPPKVVAKLKVWNTVHRDSEDFDVKFLNVLLVSIVGSRNFHRGSIQQQVLDLIHGNDTQIIQFNVLTSLIISKILSFHRFV